MGTRRGRVSRSGWVLALLVVPLLMSILGEASTVALATDHKQGGIVFGAIGPTPPVVTPGSVNLSLHVGDRCEHAPLGEVRTSSTWRVQLSITATGWLETSDVEIMPTSIGPGEVAIIYFTKAAVGPPFPIAGQVVVTGEPGGFQSVITLGGEVTKPADAAEEHEHITGCSSTPRSDSPKTGSEEPEPLALPDDDFLPEDGALRTEVVAPEPAPEAPAVEAPVVVAPPVEAPAVEEAPKAETSPAEAPAEASSTSGGGREVAT